ncbi:vascular endothelial growth factor Ab isoform X1 [Brienomyrus brachyistius]|uniref:vascular endothelial growth factor Ab isoform X1 n=1 Tax=Brienomyrus brachyistius TaxID=42636 RepID=UPI0020B353B3|nr:vascular endothelial growth factor Ab isoform X1 [Brienomyrus brachyistius]
MNFVFGLMLLFSTTLLYLSAVKTAPTSKEEGKSVVPFMDVYNKSYCQWREVLVDILQEYPDEIEHIYIPSCVVLKRCGGCCNNEALECVPTEMYNVTLQVKRLKPLRQENNFLLSFTEHKSCKCRPKKEVMEKREKKPRKAKGLKRNREREREPQCEPCSERRKRLFVQDPITCQCSCRYSELDCKSKQLELNERTCRCDKPRR